MIVAQGLLMELHEKAISSVFREHHQKSNFSSIA